MFEDDTHLSEIAKTVDVKLATVRRYYQQWQKNPDFERQFRYVRSLLRKEAPDRERMIELCARAAGIAKEQVETILHQPHGLRRMMTGKFNFPAQTDADHKRYVGLELAMLISDHLIKHGGRYEDVSSAFQQWMRQNQESREEEDADIEEENQDIAFMRRVLEVSEENERRGQVKLDRLSVEERDIILKWGAQRAIKRVEAMYWLRISELMAEGFTLEQAREKIYQDLLEKGDLEAAKAMRAYQDIVHPLKTGNRQSPPATEPPSPT